MRPLTCDFGSKMITGSFNGTRLSIVIGLGSGAIVISDLYETRARKFDLGYM